MVEQAPMIMFTSVGLTNPHNQNRREHRRSRGTAVGPLKQHLGVCRFQSNKEVAMAVREWLQM
jgi:hypothetical protein